MLSSVQSRSAASICVEILTQAERASTSCLSVFHLSVTQSSVPTTGSVLSFGSRAPHTGKEEPQGQTTPHIPAACGVCFIKLHPYHFLVPIIS